MRSKQKAAGKSGPAADHALANLPEFVSVRCYLPIGSLNPDAPYHQQVIEELAKRLAEGWDERLFEPLTVSLRDSELYVIDGRHRLAALKLRNPNDFLVPCNLFKGLTLEEEAKLACKIRMPKSINLRKLKNT